MVGRDPGRSTRSTSAPGAAARVAADHQGRRGLSRRREEHAMRNMSPRRAATIGMVFAAATSLAACSGGSAPEPTSSGNAAEGATTSEITFWDPYPQRADGSEWDKLVKSCAPAGATLVRSSAPQSDLFNQLTTAVKEGNAPDIVVLDNPMMPEAVSAGLLATAQQASIDTNGIDENLLGPGLVDGVAYGVPFGSNALGLYYNKDVLSKAGVDPASVSDWIGKGWAPRSAATDNQCASWDLFLTGEYGFAENGSWFASAAAETKGFTTAVLPIPGKDSAVAPVPTGGEFAVAPIQGTDDSNHYANASAVISCLTSGDVAVTTNAVSYTHLRAHE